MEKQPQLSNEVRFNGLKHRLDLCQEDTRSEEQMISDLGVLYTIFGNSYKTRINYHEFVINFKKLTEKQGAFCRCFVDIYEDKVNICRNVIIGFWPFRFKSDRCSDMEFASVSVADIKKYNNGCSMLYTRLSEELMDIWNSFFDERKSVSNPEIMDGSKFPVQKSFKAELSKEQRLQIIKREEKNIGSGKLRDLKRKARCMTIICNINFFSLDQFLECSGVVYEVKEEGVYICDGRLIGCEYDSISARYSLYLVF